MKRGEVFESRYMAAFDLGGKELDLVVTHVEKEEMQDGDKKAVCYFHGRDKGLIVNAGKWDVLEAQSGSDDTDDWVGTEVTAVEGTTQFKGAPKACINLKATPAKRKKGFKTDDSATAGEANPPI